MVEGFAGEGEGSTAHCPTWPLPMGTGPTRSGWRRAGASFWSAPQLRSCPRRPSHFGPPRRPQGVVVPVRRCRPKPLQMHNLYKLKLAQKFELVSSELELRYCTFRKLDKRGRPALLYLSKALGVAATAARRAGPL